MGNRAVRMKIYKHKKLDYWALELYRTDKGIPMGICAASLGPRTIMTIDKLGPISKRKYALSKESLVPRYMRNFFKSVSL